MTTPTPTELVDALGNGRYLDRLCQKWAEQIFKEQFQGDALIDDIQDLMATWGWLSEDDPDEDIKVESMLTDEVWMRIMTLILMKMQETRRYER